MRTMAYYILLYGKEWLAWSVRSVQDAVDELHFFYTPTPSHGTATTKLLCPDTEDELRREAQRFATKPVFWHRGTWKNEGEHRNAAIAVARQKGFQQVLVVDADEIWDPETVRLALDLAAANDNGIIRVRFVHFWRSLKWFCKDPALPARIIHPQAGKGEWYLSPQEWPVFHMGYAQSARTIEYKQSIHGHRHEWRPDWFERKFKAWRPNSGMKDVHPTCVDFWKPEEVDPATRERLLPLLSDHPYWDLETIS